MAKVTARKKAPAPRSVESLKTLLAQVNAFAPNRSKVSDGWIGDAKHQARHSDHNPEPDGTVDARDFTNDPSGGLDARKLCQAILDSRDYRLSYVISNGEIASGRKGPQPWVWRKYKGSNGHYHHAHISVLDEGQDDKTPWKIDSAFVKSAADNLTKKEVESVLKLGTQSEYVLQLHKNLNKLGYGPLYEGEYFGESTEAAVKRFQKDMGLKVDGWAGTRTLEAVGKELAKLKLKPQIKEAESKVEAAKEIVDDAASDGKGVSNTELLTGITGLTAISATVKQIVDVIRESTESVSSLLGLGPWVLLGVVAAVAAGYVIYDRRKKRLKAQAVQKVL